MVQPKPHIEIAYSSIACFSDDGTLDIGELNFLLGIALRDGVIDENEKRVLKNVFSQVSKGDVTEEVWERIRSVKRQHGIK